VLIGAEISYSIQNVIHFEGEQQTKNISAEQRILYHLYIIHFIAKQFANGEIPPTIVDISTRLDIPANQCRVVVQNSMKAKLVVESIDPQTKDTIYTPAVDVAKLTIGFIIHKLNGLGELRRSSSAESYHQLKHLYNEMEDAMCASPANKNIVDL
jgi:membrane protein